MLGKNKLFRCPVHNYITIPSGICNNFVDNSIFQRLKNVEQTSMRPLYPSAQHNRFVHSIGVYHLAKQAFEGILNNNQNDYEGIRLDQYKLPFEIAALMHDCAHSPFSHTFEKYYDFNNPDEKLKSSASVSDTTFKSDFEELINSGDRPKPHEIFSAYIFLEHFSGHFKEFCEGHPPALVARMITGCEHSDLSTIRNQIENCLTQLINGKAIDLDKLDYIMRDSWASGINNVSIDSYRLLSSLMIARRNSKLVPAFNKSALSVIQNVIDGKNLLTYWVHCHHTVIYYQHLLETIVEQLSKLISPDNDRFIKSFFSEECFRDPIRFNEQLIYLPNDNDLYYLLKQHYYDIPEVQEFISRSPSKFPLWKTRAEFEHVFKEKTNKEREKTRNHISSILNDIIGASSSEKILTKHLRPSVTAIEEQDLFINVRGELIDYTKAVPELATRDPITKDFFYIYIPKEHQSKKQECLEKIRTHPI